MTEEKANLTPLEELLGMGDLSNMFGPIGSDIRKRLLRVLKNPTDKTWEDAHTIILVGSGKYLTLWQAWIAVDPSAPEIGPRSNMKRRLEKWSKVPTQENLFDAIRYAAQEARHAR
jgi:hypothetical protein